MTVGKAFTLLARSAIAVAMVVATPGIAANGTHFVGISPQSSGMGGTAVGIFQGELESMHRNPALMGSSFKTGAAWHPTVELMSGFGKNNAQSAVSQTNTTLPAYSSSNDTLKILPAFALATRVFDRLNAGIALITHGGTVVDHTGTASLFQVRTELWQLRVLPSVQYAVNDWLSVGAGLVVGYNRLSLNAALPVPPGSAPSTRDLQGKWGLGGNFGVALKPMANMTVGLTYLTKSTFNYEGLFPLSALGPTPALQPDGTVRLDNFQVQEPAEVGIGASYVLGAFTFAADYRFIGWSRTSGFGELGWQDQHVIGLGAKYQWSDALALRLGMNYGKSPIQGGTGTNGSEQLSIQGVTVFKGPLDQVVLVGFPAIAELAITGGAGYQITESLGVDIALKVSPSKTITREGTNNPLAGGAAYAVSSKVMQWEGALMLNYRF